MIGTGPIGVPNSWVIPPPVSALVESRGERYRLEVWKDDGTEQYDLNDVIQCVVTERINQPAQVTIIVDRDNPYAELLTRPYRVLLINAHDQLVDEFVVIDDSDEKNLGAEFKEVVMVGRLGQLSEEWVRGGYSYTIDDGRTVLEHLRALLAYQSGPRPLTVGYVNPEIAEKVRALNVDSDKAETILWCLNELRAAVGGYFWVEPGGVLIWDVRRGWNTEHQLDYNKNMSRLKRTRKWAPLVTKLWFYGASENGSRVCLTDAGESNDYLEADTLGTYGLKERVVYDDECVDPDELVKRANEYLEDHKHPPASYEGEVQDLAESVEWDWEASERVMIGGKVLLYDTDYGAGGVWTNYAEVIRDVFSPVNVRVTLERLPENLADFMGDSTGADQKTEIHRFIDQGETEASLEGDPDKFGGARPGDVAFINDGPKPQWLGLDADGRVPPASALLDPFVMASDGATEAPPAVGGTGSAGDSEAWARQNHTHGVSFSEDDPLPVAETADVGTSEELSRADHAHALSNEMFFAKLYHVAANKSALEAIEPEADETQFGITEDTGRLYHYNRVDHFWDVVLVVREHSDASLPAIPTDEITLLEWTGGDNQIWSAKPGDSNWSPTTDWTDEDGSPP